MSHVNYTNPTVGGSNGTWGNTLNANQDKTKELLLFHAAEGVNGFTTGGTVNNATAFTDLLGLAQTEAEARDARAVIQFGQGAFGLPNSRIVPNRVAIRGAGRRATRIRNLSTDGVSTMFEIQGSAVDVSNIGIDMRPEAQSTTLGGAAIALRKPAGTTGGAASVSGGMALVEAVAGTSFFTVSAASQRPLPGEAVSFFEGANYEVVRVDPNYTGGVVVGIVGTLRNTYTTSAYVAIFSTDVTISECWIRGIFAGIDLWHSHGCKVDSNWIYDTKDTGIAVSAGGTREFDIINNHVETKDGWCIGVDTGDFDVPPLFAGFSAHYRVSGNHCKLLPGGTAFDAILIAANGPTELGEVSGNTCDISLAGNGGIRLTNDRARNVDVIGNRVYGGARALTYGIVQEGASGSTVDCSNSFIANRIHTCDFGIYVGDYPFALLSANQILDPGTHGILLVTNNSLTQRIQVEGGRIRGGLLGIGSAGATPTQTPELHLRTRPLMTGQVNAAISLHEEWTIRGDVADGRATLVAGSVTVATNVVRPNSRILLTRQPGGSGTPGTPRVSAIVTAASFTITSSEADDAGIVAWVIR